MKKNLTKSIILILFLIIISIIVALLAIKFNLKRNLPSRIETYIQSNNLGKIEKLEFVSKGKCYKKHHFDDPLGMQGPEEETKEIAFCDSYKYKVKFLNDEVDYYIYSYIDGFNVTIKENINKVKEDINYISSLSDYKKISYELNPIYDSGDYVYEDDVYLWDYTGYSSVIPNIIIVETNESISDNPYILNELNNWLRKAQERDIALKVLFKDNYILEVKYGYNDGYEAYIYKNDSLQRYNLYLYEDNLENELGNYFNWPDVNNINFVE